ncbi:MAG: MFS transporter [Acidimicrobiales bacterium]
MNRNVRPIMLLTFVNAMGGTILIPVLPFIVRDVGQSDLVFALLIATYPACQFFAAPILGSWADRKGRRPVLVLSQAGTLVSWLVFASAYFVDGAGPVIGLLAASRVIDGLTGGNQSVAAAYIVDVTSEDERTGVYGIQGSVTGLALLLGPAVGSITAASSIGFLAPALVAMALSAVMLAWMVAALPESLAPEERQVGGDLNPLHQLDLIGRARHITNAATLNRLFGVQGLFTLAFSAYTTILVLLYADRLGLEPAETGLLLLVEGVFLIFNELVTLRVAQKILGDVRTLGAGLLLMPAALVLVRLPTSVQWFLPAAFLLNVSLALIMPTLQSAITRAADDHEEGEVQGINTSVAAFMSTLAPVVGGLLYQPFGADALLGFAVAAAGAGLVFTTVRARLGPSIAPQPAGTDADHDAQPHGPVATLSHHRGGSYRNWGLNLHGRHHVHHNIRSKV